MDYLAKLVEFFKDDEEVKRLIMAAGPKKENEYRPEVYAKQLETAIDYIKYYISRMLNSFMPYELKNADEFFINIREQLNACGNDFYYLKNFYRFYFSAMRPELVDEVGKRCAGASVPFGVSLKKAKTVCELLHIIHQTVINNETIYRKMPEIEFIEKEDDCRTTLYGEDTELARNIFRSFPQDILFSAADILSFDGQFLIMVRGRGHALSIEVYPQSNGKYFVSYFIPKICDIDMVNNLKGVRPVSEKAVFTSGEFITTRDKLPSELADFISKVPTDKDMIRRQERLANHK